MHISKSQLFQQSIYSPILQTQSHTTQHSSSIQQLHTFTSINNTTPETLHLSNTQFPHLLTIEDLGKLDIW